MKFKDLKVDDRFYVNEFGWSKKIYTRLPIFSDESWNAQREDGTQTDIPSECEVIKLGPSKDSDLGEAIHNYIKENLKIEISNYKDYDNSGLKVRLELNGEVISESRQYLKTWQD